MEQKGVIYILTNPSFPQYVKIGYADYHNPAQLLAEGCCYYDADGNVVDVDAIQPEGYWYDISNVTVAPIK